MSTTVTTSTHHDPHHAAQHMLHPNLALAFTSVGDAALADDPRQTTELLRTAGTMVLAEGVRRAGIRETIASRYRSELTYGVWNAEVAGFYEFLTTVRDEKFRHLLIALWNLDANFDQEPEDAEEHVDPFAQLALRIDALTGGLAGELEQAKRALARIQKEVADGAEEPAEKEPEEPAEEDPVEEKKVTAKTARPKHVDRRLTAAALIKEAVVTEGDKIWDDGVERFVRIKDLYRVEGGRVMVSVRGGRTLEFHPTRKVVVRVGNDAVSRETSEE